MAKILIIEDETALRRDISEILSFEGYEVVEASNGLDGLQMIRNQAPDLVMCDVIMPKMNGYDVLRAFSADPSISTIPFIIMTAKSAEEDINELLELGASAYLTKPVSVNNLLEMVASLLE
jgi:CheY-like chemotaxis protein